MAQRRSEGPSGGCALPHHPPVSGAAPGLGALRARAAGSWLSPLPLELWNGGARGPRSRAKVVARAQRDLRRRLLVSFRTSSIAVPLVRSEQRRAPDLGTARHARSRPGAKRWSKSNAEDARAELRPARPPIGRGGIGRGSTPAEALALKPVHRDPTVSTRLLQADRGPEGLIGWCSPARWNGIRTKTRSCISRGDPAASSIADSRRQRQRRGRNPTARLRSVASTRAIAVTGRWMMFARTSRCRDLRCAARGGGTRLKISRRWPWASVISTTGGAEGLAVTRVSTSRSRSSEEFAQTVIELRDPARRCELGRAGRQLVHSRYSWKKVAADFEQCCETAAQMRKERRGTPLAFEVDIARHESRSRKILVGHPHHHSAGSDGPISSSARHDGSRLVRAGR